MTVDDDGETPWRADVEPVPPVIGRTDPRTGQPLLSYPADGGTPPQSSSDEDEWSDTGVQVNIRFEPQ